MKMRVVLASLACAVFVCAASSRTETRSYPFGEYGALQLTVPADWRDKQSFVGPVEGAVGLNIHFDSTTPGQWAIRLTAFWKLTESETRCIDGNRASVQKVAESFRGKVREDTIGVVAIAGRAELGYMFSITETEEKPGEYVNLTQGTACIGEATVAFSIFSNGNREPLEQQAVQMLSSAKHVQIGKP
jgi:hypothetical protein